MSQQATAQFEYAQPELRALLERGIDPLKSWLRSLALAPAWQGFHATSEWENNVLACYIAHFLPPLPGKSGLQDVIVLHLPEYWENDVYNRIFTQCSGYCAMPDVFHEFLLALTRSFGKRFIPVKAMLFWLEQRRAPDQQIFLQSLGENPRLVQAVEAVEEQEGGIIDRSTICVLNPFSPLEWLAILIVTRQGYQDFRVVHALNERITLLGAIQERNVGSWFDAMRDRAYLPRASSRGTQHVQHMQALSAMTPTGEEVDLVGPLPQQRLEVLVAQIQEIRENRALQTFVEMVWGMFDSLTRLRFP